MCFAGQGEGRNSIDWRKEVNDDQRREGQPVVRMLQLRQTLNRRFDVRPHEGGMENIPDPGSMADAATRPHGDADTRLADDRAIDGLAARRRGSKRRRRRLRAGDGQSSARFCGCHRRRRSRMPVVAAECVLGQVWSFDPVRGAWANYQVCVAGNTRPKGSSTSPYLSKGI